MKRITVADIKKQKSVSEAAPLVVLTAYTAPIAAILDTYTDILLVGDSLGMVIYGFQDTLSVTPELMIAHAGAVVRGSKRSLVVVDLPFGSYEASTEQAFQTASTILRQSGAQAVKLEGGVEMAETIRFLVARGVPVMAHIGLLPQHVHAKGGYVVQGKNAEEEVRLLADAHAIAEAGAFAVVLEGVTEPVAKAITQAIAIPTIGIGASPACNGQVLVLDDMLGMLKGKHAKFVEEFGNLHDHIEQAVSQYANAVRSRAFPEPDKHCYHQPQVKLVQGA